MKLWKSQTGGKGSHYFRTEKVWVSSRPPPKKKLPITGKEPVNWEGAEDSGTEQEHN